MRVNGCELFVETVGTGPPLLLMHGGLGMDHTCFRPWLDPLADVRTLVFYDHRGNGRSSGPLPEPSDGLDLWADDAAALADALGAERVDVLGHSFGGFIALAFALRHPGRLAKLIFCDSAARTDFWEAVQEELDRRGATEEQRRPFQVERFESPEDMADGMGALAALYMPYTDDPAKVFAETRFQPDALARGGLCLDGFDVLDRLGEIAAPTLIVGGDDDFIMPPRASTDRVAAAMPAARYEVFERSGHFPFVERTEAFLATVRSFLGD